jgi:hypothetical protein
MMPADSSLTPLETLFSANYSQAAAAVELPSLVSRQQTNE